VSNVADFALRLCVARCLQLASRLLPRSQGSDRWVGDFFRRSCSIDPVRPMTGLRRRSRATGLVLTQSEKQPQRQSRRGGM